MKLISCDNCGVVLDADKLSFSDMFDNEGHIDTSKAAWVGTHFVPFTYCPICNDKITEEQ